MSKIQNKKEQFKSETLYNCKIQSKCKKEKLINPIKELFQKARDIKEIIKVDIYESNMDLPNRYDLMIKMDLSKKALEEFDNGEIHKEWKESFGKDIMNKTIFDCD